MEVSSYSSLQLLIVYQRHFVSREIKCSPSSSAISFSMNETLVLQAWPLSPGEGLADTGTLCVLVAGSGGFVVRWMTRMPILTVVLRCSFSSARSAKYIIMLSRAFGRVTMIFMEYLGMQRQMSDQTGGCSFR